MTRACLRPNAESGLGGSECRDCIVSWLQVLLRGLGIAILTAKGLHNSPLNNLSRSRELVLTTVYARLPQAVYLCDRRGRLNDILGSAILFFGAFFWPPCFRRLPFRLRRYLCVCVCAFFCRCTLPLCRSGFRLYCRLSGYSLARSTGLKHRSVSPRTLSLFIFLYCL